MRVSKLCVAALLLSVAAMAQVTYEPGLDLRVYDLGRGVDRTPVPAEGQLPNYSAVIKAIDLSDERPAELGGLTDNFLAVISGRLEAPFTGLYVFRLTSDDGSVLLLNGQMVVDHDGLHGPEPKDSPAFLEKGFYRFELRWFEAGGGAVCKLEWKRPGGDFEPIDPRFVSTPAGVERKTAPGAKQFVIPPAPQAVGTVGLPAGMTIEPARPASYWPQVAGLARLADGRPLVLDQATGQLVWVSAGVPPQVLAKDLVDPLGVCTYQDRVYVLCAGHLWEVTAGPKGWTQRDVLRPGKDDLFTAGPVAFRDEILFTVGSDPKLCRLSAFNPAGSRAVGRLDKVPAPIGLLAAKEGLFVVEAAGSFCRLHAVDTGNRTWRFGPSTVVPTPGDLKRTCQPAEAGGLVAIGDGRNGLFLVAPDSTGGTAWRLGDGFESTPRAVLAGQDSALLVGCDGNQMTLPPFGLQRLAENGGDTFLATQAKPHANGVEVIFDQPLADPAGWDPGLFTAEQAVWGDTPPAPEKLKVLSASPGDDRRSVFLEIPGLKAGSVLHLKAPLAPASTTKLPLWNRELWVTINTLPADKGQVRPAPEGVTPNKLTAAEQAAGWKLLFDGEKIDAFRGFRRQDTPGGWFAGDGWLRQRAGGGGGDLMTKDTFENFELAIDFVMSKGCNSGIMYRVTEDVEPSFASGPEVQIQDDGSRNSTEIHSCGALYEMFAPNDQKDLNPPGEINHFLIRLVKGKGEHWLNGRKIVEYQIGSDAWNAQYKGSKFAQWNRFGTEVKGHLVIQDHGTEVWYRSIKIREIAN